MQLELLQKMEILRKDELHTQLALQCAPLIMGVKVSNLLKIDGSQKQEFETIFQHARLRYYLLTTVGLQQTYLLYDEYKLLAILNQDRNRSFLQEQGYRSGNLFAILKRLARRYTNYRNGEGEFPHEMGVILGYPVNDVKAFIANEGKNFIYRGYWKVYYNIEEAKQIFYQYYVAKERMVQLLVSGITINQIVCKEDYVLTSHAS